MDLTIECDVLKVSWWVSSMWGWISLFSGSLCFIEKSISLSFSAFSLPLAFPFWLKLSDPELFIIKCPPSSPAFTALGNPPLWRFGEHLCWVLRSCKTIFQVRSLSQSPAGDWHRPRALKPCSPQPTPPVFPACPLHWNRVEMWTLALVHSGDNALIYKITYWHGFWAHRNGLMVYLERDRLSIDLNHTCSFAAPPHMESLVSVPKPWSNLHAYHYLGSVPELGSWWGGVQIDSHNPTSSQVALLCLYYIL